MSSNNSDTNLFLILQNYLRPMATMDASFFSKPRSQLECRDNKKSCHLMEKKGTHPMRMHENNTTCNRSNQNAGFLDTTNTTCNRSNQNARLPDTHSRSTNQHPAAPDTTKTTCYRSAAQCWKAFLVCFFCKLSSSVNNLLGRRPEIVWELWSQEEEICLQGQKAVSSNC